MGFELGPFTIRYYSLILAAAILVCWRLALKLAKKHFFSAPQIENFLFLTVILGFVGARIFVVVFDWQDFRADFSEIYKIWHGGLAIYGAVFGGFVAAVLYSWKTKIKTWKLLDLLAIVTPLGQAIGRWGNFFNQEAFGPPTNLPWKIYIDPSHRLPQYLGEKFYQPTFLYESLWDLLVFIILLYLSNRGPKSGVLFACYLALYSCGRFFIEYLRLDSQYFFSWRLNQFISAVIFLLALGILFKTFKINAKNT